MRRSPVWMAHLIALVILFASNKPAQSMPLNDPLHVDSAQELADPIFNPQPPSTLLSPDTTSLELAVQSQVNTACSYTIGEASALSLMTPFAEGANSTTHRTVVEGLDPDPNRVNEIFVRCDSAPEFVLHLRYRVLAVANPSFPRIGNLWGSSYFADKELSDIARIDLWQGAKFSPAQMRELRQQNPQIQFLASMNAIEGEGAPDDYYLKDIHGNRAEFWPGLYRLNLTNPAVAEYQARRAYELIVNADLMFDGVFFDNVMLTQSWQTTDLHGNLFLVDANGDGVQDDPAAFDAAWRAGVLHQLDTFRALMPHALVSGHVKQYHDPELLAHFNGLSMGFWTADVIEGHTPFEEVWDDYTLWQQQARQPTVNMFEASPIDQFAYGYGFEPWGTVPPATLEFARTYYPWMRFGLALTLMEDGYFTYEFGDTWHGQDWWYDEFDFDLGYPLGPAQPVGVLGQASANLIANGSFEQAPESAWALWVDESSGGNATIQQEQGEAPVGSAALRIDINAAADAGWQISLSATDCLLQNEAIYEVRFWAKSDVPRTITVNMHKSSPDWDNFGLWQEVAIGATWAEHTLHFTANATAQNASLQFLLGDQVGTVWLDEVQLIQQPLHLFRREFTNGLVLLNGTHHPQRVTVGAGWRRLQGDQAPLAEWIVDDGDPAFSTTGQWQTANYDSGQWKASGPYYHNWGIGLHERVGAEGEARWALAIPHEDTYTITVWWPAAPGASGWSEQAIYEVVADGQVLASQTLSQRTGGDEWQPLATVHLKPEDDAHIRLRCTGDAPCMADALHVRSAARYNDGSVAETVTLAPFDGIILERRQPLFRVTLPMVSEGR
jgi:hypothetical protein